MLDRDGAYKRVTSVEDSVKDSKSQNQALSSASEVAMASQRVSNLFWSAVMKSAIWALLLANGAFMVTQAHYSTDPALSTLLYVWQHEKVEKKKSFF